MFTPDTYDEQLVRVLSCSPVVYDLSMIKLPEPRFAVVPSIAARENPGTGDLLLPPELLSKVFYSLDFRTLENLRAVNSIFKQFIEVFPAYQQFVKHAPNTLRALSITKLISQFDAAQLYDALRSDRCLECSEYGPYLLLPACERCCFNCLHDNLSLRVVPVTSSLRCFGLKRSQIEGLLPVMLSVPGNYGLGCDRNVRCSKWLISVKRAQELALEVHGSQAVMTDYVKCYYGKLRAAYEKRHRVWFYRRRNQRRYGERCGNEPLQPQSVQDILESPNDQFLYMASIPFPSIDKITQKIEHGIWCRGCDQECANPSPLTPQEQQLFNADNAYTLDSLDYERAQSLRRMQVKSYSRREIVQHFKVCNGVKRLWTNGYIESRLAMERDLRLLDSN